MLISMSEYDMANDRLDYRTEKNKMSKDEANLYAKKIIIDDKISQQKHESKPEVYNTPLASSTHPTHPMPPHVAPVISTAHRTPTTHNDQAMNSSTHGVNSQPPHYQEPKVSDVNSLPYPKSSTNDIYTNYAPLEGSSVASEMTIQHHDKPFPMMPAPSQQSTNSVSSFNGYDSTDNYSSY